MQNGPLPLSPQIWSPSENSFGLDAPNSSSLWYVWDKKMFAKFGRSVHVYIRRCTFGEFPRQHSSTKDAPLWVLVIRIAEWHLRLPVWRGPQFFATDRPSNAAIMMTVLDYISREECESAAADGRLAKPNA
jgi:hypothetical protein